MTACETCVLFSELVPLRFLLKSDGQEKSTKILISWQELKNKFLSFFVHRHLLGREET